MADVRAGGAARGHSWDPGTYLAFGDERARPFSDLLARVGAVDPGYVLDLGCGPGNLTATLLDRWPGAHVHGVDSSPEMVQRAEQLAADHAEPAGRASARTGSLTFETADLRDLRPRRPVDVLVSNATLQWVPGHLDLLRVLAGWLAPEGWLAFQVPGNLGSPSHTLLHDLAADDRFAAYTAGTARLAVHEPQDYLARLYGLGLRPEVWETTYLHVLSGPDPVLRWVSGTGARPVLQALPERLRKEFEQEYAAALRRAYPPQPFGTVLPFRRLFAVAQAV
jgi:trans-aconitate 2-methyltransferase